MAGVIVNASMRSLLTGTDFGDNIIKSLPDVLAQTVGSALEQEIGNYQQGSAQSNGGPIGTVTVTPEVQMDEPPIPYPSQPIEVASQIPEVTFDDGSSSGTSSDGSGDSATIGDAVTMSRPAVGILGPAITGDSALGNWLNENVPLVGGMLARMGDVANGVYDLATGSFGQGANEIAGGIGGLVQIEAADALATALGAIGKVYVIAEDAINVLTMGKLSFADMSSNGVSEDRPSDFGGALKRFVYDLVIPDYGLQSGPNYGTTQWGDLNAPFLNLADDTARVHDQHLDNGEWVNNQVQPTPPGIVPTGPVGILNFLLGAPVFELSSDSYSADPANQNINKTLDLTHYPTPESLVGYPQTPSPQPWWKNW